MARRLKSGGPCHDPAREGFAAVARSAVRRRLGADRLSGYPVDPAQASIFGISSSAFMAEDPQY